MVSSHDGTLSGQGSVGLWKVEQTSGKAIVGYLEKAQNLGRRSGSRSDSTIFCPVNLSKAHDLFKPVSLGYLGGSVG